MKSKIPIEELLRWRLDNAKSEAPLAPCAARLLDLARPWWERSPEKRQLPKKIAQDRKRLKTTDRAPLHLIIRSSAKD
jgi:hypothetical protein